MQDMVLYYKPSCAFCHRVFGAADALGIELETRNIVRSEQDRADLIAATGRRTVPVLRYTRDGEEVWLPESADIIALLRRHAGAPERPWRDGLPTVNGGLLVVAWLSVMAAGALGRPFVLLAVGAMVVLYLRHAWQRWLAGGRS